MDPLEKVYRAMMAVERFTDMEPGYYGYIRDLRRAYGGVFACGEFATGQVVVGRTEDFGRIDYHVVEVSSRLIFGHAHATRAEALAEARSLIEDMGMGFVSRWIAERNTRVAPPASEERAIAPKQPKPRKVGKRARAVFEASEGKCHYCGVGLDIEGRWHIEHKMPRALFGGSEQSNLAASCAPCNHAKRDKTDLEFKAA